MAARGDRPAGSTGFAAKEVALIAAALEYEGVSFTFPEADRPALDHVNISITEGTFVLAAGPTAAGKSTFLRAANGLVPHFTGGTFTGRVLAAGRDTLSSPPRRLAGVVAFVPQEPGASFVLDQVEEEIAYGMENLGVEAKHMRRRVEEMLDLLDIAALRMRSVRTLSGGEQQRVAIAAALAAGPRILVLDEPTSQLDPQGAEHVMAALQRLVHDHGMTVMLAEHRLERVAGWVDSALGFDSGRVRAGEPAEVLGGMHVGPPVARLGKLLGWESVPLTVRAARAAAGDRLPRNGHPRAAPARGQTLVDVKALSADHGAISAIRNLDLEIGRGEIVAVMGRNGAGKTTLLRAIAGLHPPAKGSVLVDGDAPRPGIDVALCPQQAGSILFAERGGDEIRATMRARGISGSPSQIAIELGIEDLLPLHPRDLSAGQRLLVATAAIAVARAPVLLLDEPTRGLDPDTKQRLTTFLKSYAGDDACVIVATHDVELAASLATRVVILAAGEVVADGDPGEVLGDSSVFAPQMTRVFGPGWLTPEQVAQAMA
jgi:energy-coupling factor transport system ATP-binding protein